MLKGVCPMCRYQLSPHVFLEVFDDDAVLLIADRDVMVSVNHAAAQLFECASSVVGRKTFSREDCVDFLLGNFSLGRAEAEAKARSVLGFSLRRGIVTRPQAA
jgi:hypothetical protein